jgi:hypothetical protein
MPAMSYAAPPVPGASGTAQFLSGRGLY